MIVDARSLPESAIVDTDVCIVGAGVAGITLAREFVGEEFQVCLLESGGLGPDRVTQSLYWGENVGHPYYPLDTARTCCFGGTSHRWLLELGDNRLGARTRPLDEIDFEQRDWVPYSGWPFDKAYLDPFYERAQSIFKIGSYDYKVENWENPEYTPRLPLVSDRVETVIFQFGTRDTFIRDYRDEIDRADNITTYLHANVVEIETTETAQTVTRLRVACVGGRQLWVSAKWFILASGAIETPHLLLLSNKRQSAGLGNQHDLVGRFFMEHPHLWSGIYVPSDPRAFNSAALYKIHPFNDVAIQGKLALAEGVLRGERLLNYCTSIHPAALPHRLRYPGVTSKGVDSLKVLRSAIRSGKMPENLGEHMVNLITGINGIATSALRKAKMGCEEIIGRFKPPSIEVFRLNSMSEQAPNPNSRVTLTDERDALGRRRVRLDWQLSPLDIRTISRAQEIIDEELRRAGLGHLVVELEGETPPPDLHGGWHHMGTTRMHVDSKQGVVDENCRVHGMSNLFIAPPSVFPTSGYANPVLTIIALSVRLADHVKRTVTR
jgi:choline dehydrogenase-like flavoprotein